MKLSHFGIVFVIVLLCLVVRTDIKEQLLVGVTNQKLKLDRQIDNAMDDSIANLVEVDSIDNIKLNKEIAVEQFYQSLASNMGILDNKAKRNLLKVYIPVILITDLDGFYINYNVTDEDGILRNVWTEKVSYSIEENGVVYSFLLGEQRDYIRILDSSGTMKEGAWQELKNEYPNSELLKNFDEYRRKVIINCITEKMQFYINRHNRIASQYGITYNFTLPVISDDDWKRTIDDISMMVMFQGYQYGTSRTMVYNRYTIGGARVSKQNMYYVQNVDGRKYYHKEDCGKLIDKSDVYTTKKEAAKQGAFACPICNP